MRLIWGSFDMQYDTVVEIWLSKDSVGSKITPRSLTDLARLMSFPSRDNLRSLNVHCKMKRAKSTPKAKSAPFSRGPIWNMLGRFGQKESKQF